MKVHSLHPSLCRKSDLKVLEYFKSRMCSNCHQIPLFPFKNSNNLYLCSGCLDHNRGNYVNINENQNLEKLIIECKFKGCEKFFNFNEILEIQDHENLYHTNDFVLKDELISENRLCYSCNENYNDQSQHDCLISLQNKIKSLNENMEEKIMSKSIILIKEVENRLKSAFHSLSTQTNSKLHYYDLEINKLKSNFLEYFNHELKIRDVETKNNGSNFSVNNLEERVSLKNDIDFIKIQLNENKINHELFLHEISVIKKIIGENKINFAKSLENKKNELINQEKSTLQDFDRLKVEALLDIEEKVKISNNNKMKVDTIEILKNINSSISQNFSNLYKEIQEINSNLMKFSETDFNCLIRYLDIKTMNASFENKSQIFLTKDLILLNGIIKHEYKGHSNIVKSALQYNREIIVSSSYDKSIKLWNLKSKKLIKSLDECHTDNIQCLILINETNTVVSGSKDGDIKFWNLSTGIPEKTFRNHLKSEKIVGIHSLIQFNEETIISGSSDGTIKFLNFKTNCIEKSFIAHKSSVSSLILLSDSSCLVSGSVDRTIKLWDTKTNENIFTFSGHSKTVTSVIKLKGKNTIASASFDATIIFWNLDEFKIEKQIDTTDFGCQSGNFMSLLELNQSKILISGSNDCSLIFWSLMNYQCLRVVFLDNIINCLIQLDDHRILINQGDSISIWN